MPGSPSDERSATPPASTAPRRGRISRSRDFDAVYRRGRSAAGRHLIVYAFRPEGADAAGPPRLGLSVSRKVGGAVDRNRVKRAIRERFAALEPAPPGGADIVVIARPGCLEYLDERGSEALGARLGELVAGACEGMEASA